MEPSLARTVEVGVEAFAMVEAARSTMPAFRKQVLAEYSLSPSLLKYAEEQTVVSLAAVLKAIRSFGLTDRAFTEWRVVSGPRFLGREFLTRYLDKFHRQGPLAASPLITPYLSLHAVSGTISLALQSHGPNLGVGGSAGNVQEALLAGLVMQQEHALPGVWVTASEWDPEPIPDDAGQQPEPVCRAVALALTPAMVNGSRLSLRLLLHGNHQDCPPSTVANLAEFLAARHVKWSCLVGGQGCLELTTTAAAQSSRAA
jgi:hypothetical protein